MNVRRREAETFASTGSARIPMVPLSAFAMTALGENDQ